MENENKVIHETTVNETVENETNQTSPVNRCPNCQALLGEGLTFCPECGTPLKKLCQNCKTELQEGQAFCPSCGQKNTDEIAQPASSIEQFNQNIINYGNKTNNKKKILSIIGIVVIRIFIGITRNSCCTKFNCCIRSIYISCVA